MFIYPLQIDLCLVMCYRSDVNLNLFTAHTHICSMTLSFTHTQKSTWLVHTFPPINFACTINNQFDWLN